MSHQKMTFAEWLALLTFVPLGRLVEEEHDSLSVVDLELFLY